MSKPPRASEVSWRYYRPTRGRGKNHAFLPIEVREGSLCGLVWQKDTTEEVEERERCSKCKISIVADNSPPQLSEKQLEDAVLRIRGQWEPPKKKPYICGWTEGDLICWKTHPHDGLHVSRWGIVFDAAGQYGSADLPPLAKTIGQSDWVKVVRLEAVPAPSSCRDCDGELADGETVHATIQECMNHLAAEFQRFRKESRRKMARVEKRGFAEIAQKRIARDEEKKEQND